MQKIQIKDFSLKIGYIGSVKWKKLSTNRCVSLHIYLRTNKTLIHNSLYVFDNQEGKIWAIKLQEENVYLKGQANPDNQCPDKWVLLFNIFRHRSMLQCLHQLDTQYLDIFLCKIYKHWITITINKQNTTR